MPQLIAFGLIGAVVWYGYKAFRKEMVRVGEELRQEEAKAKEITVLEADEDGVYRPRQKDS